MDIRKSVGCRLSHSVSSSLCHSHRIGSLNCSFLPLEALNIPTLFTWPFLWLLLQVSAYCIFFTTFLWISGTCIPFWVTFHIKTHRKWPPFPTKLAQPLPHSSASWESLPLCALPVRFLFIAVWMEYHLTRNCYRYHRHWSCLRYRQVRRRYRIHGCHASWFGDEEHYPSSHGWCAWYLRPYRCCDYPRIK